MRMTRGRQEAFQTNIANEARMFHVKHPYAISQIRQTYYSGEQHQDYVSLTDIARYRSVAPKSTIQNWMRNHEVVEYLGLWELLNNPNFKGIEFEAFKQEAGRNAFTLSPKQWIERTHAIGMTSCLGRYGGWDRGKRFTAQILNSSNSRSLKMGSSM